jgi:threonine synthase
MTVALSKAREEGARAVVCASTGNTGASAAAYAGRAGITCAVLVPQGNVAYGKLAQALVHGARVLEIDGNFDHALAVTKEIAARHEVALVNSVNPYRIEGQKTGAFEVVEALGRAPDVHIMPVGNAGNITAYWRGYTEACDAGWCAAVPRMFGCQAKGADPIVRGAPIASPETIATAIRIGNPASWSGAVEAASRSGGDIVAVADDDIVDAFRNLAVEGVFVELASAASVAGLVHLSERGAIARGSTVVCVLTGHGLKDLGAVDALGLQPTRLRPDYESIVAALDLS